MKDEFIREQAKQFAKIVHRGASKYNKLNELSDRLHKELMPFDTNNRTLFIKYWKEELDRVFYDHLQKAQLLWQTLILSTSLL